MLEIIVLLLEEPFAMQEGKIATMVVLVCRGSYYTIGLLVLLRGPSLRVGFRVSVRLRSSVDRVSEDFR